MGDASFTFIYLLFKPDLVSLNRIGLMMCMSFFNQQVIYAETYHLLHLHQPPDPTAPKSSQVFSVQKVFSRKIVPKLHT